MHDEDKRQLQAQNLRSALNRLRDELNDADREDVMARYAVASICVEVKDETKYGEKGLDFLESELDMGHSTLYRYAKVAEAWTYEEFQKLAARLNAKGRTLSWSHWELLAAQKDGRRRSALLDRTLKESLSVRDLESLIRETAAVQATNAARLRHAGGGRDAAQVMGLLLTSLEKEARVVENRLVAQFAARTSKPADAELLELRAMLKHLSAALCLLTSLAGRIQDLEAQATSLPVGLCQPTVEAVADAKATS